MTSLRVELYNAHWVLTTFPSRNTSPDASARRHDGPGLKPERQDVDHIANHTKHRHKPRLRPPVAHTLHLWLAIQGFAIPGIFPRSV